MSIAVGLLVLLLLIVLLWWVSSKRHTHGAADVLTTLWLLSFKHYIVFEFRSRKHEIIVTVSMFLFNVVFVILLSS